MTPHKKRPNANKFKTFPMGISVAAKMITDYITSGNVSEAGVAPGADAPRGRFVLLWVSTKSTRSHALTKNVHKRTLILYYIDYVISYSLGYNIFKLLHL